MHFLLCKDEKNTKMKQRWGTTKKCENNLSYFFSLSGIGAGRVKAIVDVWQGPKYASAKCSFLKLADAQYKIQYWLQIP